VFAIRPAHFPEDRPVVAALFREYADFLGFDLSFQDFEGELATLPGHYAAPAGVVLMAWSEDKAAGCVCLRPLENNICEMKRLYLRPDHRGAGQGRRLVERILAEARKRGYSRMVLDTVPQLQAAIGLYQSLGFVEIDAYTFNPVPGVRFYGCDL